ncbi:MAG: BPL-N domain-containing protein [Promethearchaeota archaeon]
MRTYYDIILKILFILLPIMLISFALIPIVDVSFKPNHLCDVQVAFYNGSGAGPYVFGATTHFFNWAGCLITNVTGQDIIDGCLENFDILCWPGGHYPAFWDEMGLAGKNAVQNFVQNGGGYLGICAGAYYACDYIVWMDDPAYPPPDYKVEGDELNLDLCEAVAWGPIFEIAPRPEPGYDMTQIDIVNHIHPITDNLPDHMQIIYIGGPYLVPYVDADLSILGVYNETNDNAIIACSYGNGRVFLIGPHAEIEEDSYRDGWEPLPDLSDEGSDWPLLYNAVEWLSFQSINNSTTNNSTAVPFCFPLLILCITLYFFKKRKTALTRK